MWEQAAAICRSRLKLFKAAEQAAKLTSTVRGQLETIRTRAAPLKRTRMMFVVGRTPNRLDGLIVVGQASYLNEIIKGD